MPLAVAPGGHLRSTAAIREPRSSAYDSPAVGSLQARRISLSVGRENFAHRLYLGEGYRIVDMSDANSDTMIKDLHETR